MERYLKRKISSIDGESSSQYISQPSSTPSMPKKIDINDLPWDPADRKRILDYDHNQREEIRRLYWQRGPCQPDGHVFPQKAIGSKERRFVFTWFKEFPWLEYSVKADKVYCLCCYLFRDQFGQQGGSDAFLSFGFNSWGKKKRLTTHVGDITSFHHKALQKCEDLMKPKQSIAVVFQRQSERDNEEYRIQLKASLDAVRFLMFNTLPFLSYFNTFDFVFNLHLMLRILGLTNALSQALQRKDQNIVEAVSLVQGTKRSLQKFRENGFDEILKCAYPFCEQHNLERLDMDEVYIISRNRKTNFTNRHYFKVDIFNTVLDMQIQEFGDRFGEISTELLSNMSALSPRDSFSMFDKKKLMNLSKMYPFDFTHTEREQLEGELDIYYDIIQRDEKFANLNGIADLSRLMVETGKHFSYRYVYRLLKLALVLPVATATVERCFSTMKLVKFELRNRMGDGFLNDCLIGAIEKEALLNATDQAVMKRFQKMEDRRGQLN